MWEAEYRLYLYPTGINKKTTQKKLESDLQKIKFIDGFLNEESGADKAYRYKVGEGFLSLICFMGCSPNIEIEPQEDSPFCYVEIPSETNVMRFVAGDNVKKVNCPHCKKPQPELAKQLSACNVGELFSQQCTVCNETIDPCMINWRKSAFMASACEWKYAYVRLKQKKND